MFPCSFTIDLSSYVSFPLSSNPYVPSSFFLFMCGASSFLSSLSPCVLHPNPFNHHVPFFLQHFSSLFFSSLHMMLTCFLILQSCNLIHTCKSNTLSYLASEGFQTQETVVLIFIRVFCRPPTENFFFACNTRQGKLW